MLVRLLKEVNRSKATSPKPNEQIAVAKNLTVMGISDREIMETRPYNQRVNLVSNNASGFDAFGLDDFGDDDDIGDKDDGEQLTREKIKKASSTLATQHDKSRKRKTTKGKHRRKSSAEGGLPPMS